MTLLILLAAAAAPGPTAEEAIVRYREIFKPTAELDCPKANGDEAVVCGRRDQADPHRLPLPVEREPGEPTRLVAGEPPRPSNPEYCLRLCSQPVDLLKAGKVAAKIVSHLFDPD